MAFHDQYKEGHVPPDPMKRTYAREYDAFSWRQVPERAASSHINRPLRYGPERQQEYPYEFDARMCGRQLSGKPQSQMASRSVWQDNFYLTDVDLNIGFNTEQHHTDQFECTTKRQDPRDPNRFLEPELVIRRGQSFFMTLNFNEPYHRDRHLIRLVFRYNASPDPMKNMMAELDINKTHDPPSMVGAWHMRIVKIVSNSILLEIMTPATCIIGEWTLRIYSQSLGVDEKEEIYFEYPTDISILLNPWNRSDTVYMDTENCVDMGMRGFLNPLDEYVLNDCGAVYRGTYRNPEPKPWFYGQYEVLVLKICFHLVRKAFGFKITKELGDPIAISRAISQIINANNDSGVLVGNWEGDYENPPGSFSPTHWQSSETILHEYQRQAGRPVRYAQCWVFSAVTVTVCRAIGLPCRSVTNYISAHDTNKNINIDIVKEVDGNGDLVTIKDDDSIWNFHVWNDVWMARSDLPEGFDGWQVIDATPQELSCNDKKCCGPAPLVAVKNGLVDVPFDTAFVFSEVNADRVTYEKLPNGKMKIIRLEPSLTGKYVATKIPDGNPLNPTDTDNVYGLTRRYKYPEGSVKERQAVMAAREIMRMPAVSPESVERQEVTIEVSTGKEVVIGSDVYITVKMANENRYRATRYIEKLQILIESRLYCGGKRKLIKKEVFRNIPMKYRQLADFTVDVRPSEYLPHLCEQFILDIKVDATIAETGGIVTHQTEYRLLSPVLQMQGPRMCMRGERVPISASFRNPLRHPLTNCKLYIETRGIAKAVDIKENIHPGENWTTTVLISPFVIGRGCVFGKVECKELPDVHGSLKLEVRGRK